MTEGLMPFSPRLNGDAIKLKCFAFLCDEGSYHLNRKRCVGKTNTISQRVEDSP
jgi:hypothetical protein